MKLRALLFPPKPHLTGDVHQTWPGKHWWQKPGPWCRFKDRLGRRGAMLLTLGVTYAIIGYGETTRLAPRVPGAWHLLLPDNVRGAAWILTGAVAVFFALVRPYRDRDPAHWWEDDTPGWLALYAVPMVYIASFLTSWVLWLITDPSTYPPHGDPMAWYNAALRIPFVLIVLICSGWLENPRKCR